MTQRGCILHHRRLYSPAMVIVVVRGSPCMYAADVPRVPLKSVNEHSACGLKRYLLGANSMNRVDRNQQETDDEWFHRDCSVGSLRD